MGLKGGNPAWDKDPVTGKGKSGNPGGRPKIRQEFLVRARKAVDKYCLEAWIQEVQTHGDDWVKCSEMLAHYGYGKPPQSVELSTPPGQDALSITVNLVKPDGGDKG